MLKIDIVDAALLSPVSGSSVGPRRSSVSITATDAPPRVVCGIDRVQAFAQVVCFHDPKQCEGMALPVSQVFNLQLGRFDLPMGAIVKLRRSAST